MSYRERRRMEDDAAREWKGGYRSYDLVKEFSIAVGVILALSLVLTILFSSRDESPSTIKQWSRPDPFDIVITAVSELGGSSALAGYGPPYNHNGNGQNIWFIHPAKWFGVSHPIDTAKDFVLAPLGSITGQPALRSAVSADETAPAKTQTGWTDAYMKALGNANANPDGSISVKPGDYGPLPTMMNSLLSFAQGGGLDGVLLTSKQQEFGPARVPRRAAACSLGSVSSPNATSERFQVLIAGGGVAALEAALALRDLAGERISITVLAPQPEFVYRPMRVREPFAYSSAQHYALDEIARDIGVELVQDSFKWLDPDKSVVHTEGGEALSYDALLLALGARLHPAFSHALTIDDRKLDEQLHGLIQDVEGGYVHSLAFVGPSPMPWPLPIYELALMTARRAYDTQSDVSITIATPEDAPLAIFGAPVSDAVRRLLEENGIMTLTSAHCAVHESGHVAIHPGGRTLHVDRVVALPQLFGPSTPGVPGGPQGGFIPIDTHCKVRGLEGVYAAGDATDFPIKHGGIAAQQADTAAGAIAALAGAPIDPRPFHPEIHAILLGGDKPIYLSAHVTGGHGSSSQVSEEPTWSPPTKIAARYLAPYLESRDVARSRT